MIGAMFSRSKRRKREEKKAGREKRKKGLIQPCITDRSGDRTGRRKTSRKLGTNSTKEHEKKKKKKQAPKMSTPLTIMVIQSWMRSNEGPDALQIIVVKDRSAEGLGATDTLLL